MLILSPYHLHAQHLFSRLFPNRTIAGRLARLPRDRETVFIQIGSNDGVQGDPIYEIARKRGWSGILVEPVTFLVERLKKAYGDQEKFEIYNVAISDSPGLREFYYLDQKAGPALGLPYWYDQLGAFNREHISKHFRLTVDDFIQEEMVRCMTLSQIIDDAGFEKFDILHIDAEGYDYNVLNQLDFHKYSPKLIVYENKHLSEGERRAAEELLRTNRYKLEAVGDDCFCVREFD